MRRHLLSAAVALACASVVPQAQAAVLDDVQFQLVASSLPQVLAIRHANDGSRRIFLVQRTGAIRIVDGSGTLLATPFLNIGSGGTAPPLGLDTSYNEQGLLGLAFHPQYAQNGRFFIYYTDANDDLVIAEYAVSAANPNVADPNSARVILRIYKPNQNHNGGDIHFGPDGYLYAGIGDGGSGNDPCNSGQSLSVATMSGCTPDAQFLATPPSGVPAGNPNSRALLGKMLRIDIDSTDTPSTGADLCGADNALRTYGIPADNPYAGDNGGNLAACDEIWHYGLRNPWRFSFDRQTHDLIIGDVGQDRFEELNLVSGSASARNFGWKICEGFHVRGSTTDLCTLAGRTDPIIEYGRSFGYSIAGGWRYRGPYSELDGVMFTGDYMGPIYALIENAGTWDWNQRKTWTNSSGCTGCNNVGSIVGFGEDEAGHLYAANLSAGRVLKIILPPRVTDAPALALDIDVNLVDTNGNSQADVGETVQFVYTVRNTGNISLTWGEVDDSFGNTVACVPALIKAGESADCGAASRVVSQADGEAGALQVVASASATRPDGASIVTSDDAQASIPIEPNQAPTAHAQSVSTMQDTPVAVVLSGSDADGSIVSYAIATPPSHGVLSGTAPNLVYTPDADYAGADSFTFTVTDNQGATSAPATVAITVTTVALFADGFEEAE